MDLKQTTRKVEPWAELIVRNGRHAGSRRPISSAVVLIGRAVGSDLRLPIEGIEPQHCVLVRTNDGALVRSLHADAVALVNGVRVQNALLKDGDILTLGMLRFEIQHRTDPVQLEKERKRADEEAAQREAWRIQIAAVAAQQAALEEEEVRLQQQRQALAEHEDQVSTNLEEKRLKLVAFREEAKAERETLARERAGYEAYIAKITGDLTTAQRELMDGQRQVDQQRQRLSDFHSRLKQRWHRFWLKERKIFRAQQAELIEQMRRFEQRVAELKEDETRIETKRLRFNALYEESRGRIRDSWKKLRDEQYRWKHRKGKERAALRVRERDLEQVEGQLIQAQELFLLDKKAWDAKKQSLELELHGLERRVANQRFQILDGREALIRLGQGVFSHQVEARDTPRPGTAIIVANGNSDSPDAIWQRRMQELQALDAMLADQRLALVEQWQRLTLVHRHWQKEKDHAAAELEAIARKLLEQGETLAQREQGQQALGESMRKEHEELIHLRHQMIAWRARLRVRETAWEADRSKMLAEVKHRETLAEQQHLSLVELRDRWARSRTEELERFEAEHRELEELKQETHRLREELLQRTHLLEDEKRQLTEKALAIEQVRQELLNKTEQASAERKLERYRRRWITQNTVALRRLAGEREAIQQELAKLEARSADVDKRVETYRRAESKLSQAQAAWEHQQALALTRQTRLQEELKHAELQRGVSEEKYLKMREEIERIARSLFAEPESPTWTEELAA